MDVAATMLDIAKSTRNSEHRQRLVDNVQKAIDTVHHFKGRLRDEDQWLQLERNTYQLEQTCAALRQQYNLTR